MKKLYSSIFILSCISLLTLISSSISAFINIKSISISEDIDHILIIIKKFTGVAFENTEDIIVQLQKIESGFKVTFLLIITALLGFLIILVLFNIIRSLISINRHKLEKHIISIVINILLLFIGFKFYNIISLSYISMSLYLLFLMLTCTIIIIYSFISYKNFKRDSKYILQDPIKTMFNILPDVMKFTGAILVIILVFYGAVVISLMLIDNWLTAQILKYDLSKDIISGISNLIDYNMSANQIFGTNIPLLNFSLADFNITQGKFKMLLNMFLGPKINSQFVSTTSWVVNSVLYGDNYVQIITIYSTSIIGVITLLIPSNTDIIDLIKRIIITVVSIIISITALFILNTTGFVASTNFATGIVKLIQPTMWILLVFSIILLIDIASKIYKKYIKE